MTESNLQAGLKGLSKACFSWAAGLILLNLLLALKPACDEAWNQGSDESMLLFFLLHVRRRSLMRPPPAASTRAASTRADPFEKWLSVDRQPKYIHLNLALGPF